MQPASRSQHALPLLQLSRLDCRAYWCYPGIPDGANGTLVHVPSLCHPLRSSLEAQATGEPIADQDELDKDVQDRVGHAWGDEAADGSPIGRDVLSGQELSSSHPSGAGEEEDTSSRADRPKASRVYPSSVDRGGRYGGHGFVAHIPAGSYLLVANSSRLESPDCSYLVMLKHAQVGCKGQRKKVGGGGGLQG